MIARSAMAHLLEIQMGEGVSLLSQAGTLFWYVISRTGLCSTRECWARPFPSSTRRGMPPLLHLSFGNSLRQNFGHATSLAPVMSWAARAVTWALS
jgi:hypothetical protein